MDSRSNETTLQPRIDINRTGEHVGYEAKTLSCPNEAGDPANCITGENSSANALGAISEKIATPTTQKRAVLFAESTIEKILRLTLAESAPLQMTGCRPPVDGPSF